MTKLILDTDIGTDVDDALALGVLLGSPEVDLIGVTAVYGDTLLRARLARRLARIARPDLAIPFIPGARETLSGREVWWPGHEGALFDDLAEEPVDESLDAIAYLIETVAAAPGEIDVLAIGPLTNIALALRLDPGFARNVRRVVVMGGDFATERIVEHNFRCDTVAAREVFDSELDLVVTGLDITTQVALRQPEIDAIEGAGAFGRALRDEIAQFWRFHGKPWNNPHDPVSALSVITPELFRLEPRDVVISSDGLSDDHAPSRRTRVVRALDAEAVTAEVVQRIVAAGA
jgi:purine nucleosidase